MTDSADSLAVLGRLVASLLQPLADRVDAGEIRLLLAELGLSFPPALDTDGGLVASTQSAVLQLEQLPGDVEALVAAVTADDIGAILSTSVALAQAIAGTITGVESVANAIRGAGGGAGIPPGELNQFCDKLPGRLVDYLVVRRLESLPAVADVLDFVGAVTRTVVPAVDAAHPAFELREVHLDRLLGFLKDPAGNLLALYQWGSAAFDGTALLTKLYGLLALSGVPAVLDTSGPHPVLDVVFLEISPALDVNPPGLEIKIAQKFEVGSSPTFVRDEWKLGLVLDAAIGVGDSVVIQPNDHVTIVPAAGQVSGDVKLEWTGVRTDGTAYTIIGVAGASRLEVQQLRAGLQAGFSWNPTTNRAEADFTVSGSIVGGRVVVDLSSADGFVATLLGGAHIDSSFAVDFGYSSAHGVFFQGAAALDIQIPIHVSVGPIDFTALTVSVSMQPDGIPVGAAVDVKGNLGPLQAVVQQIGFTALFTMPADKHGNLGPLDVGFGFKPPTGVGLSLDAGIVSGGGFLSIDTARGEYAGALQLVFADFLTVSAIGLINTKMPDGTPGFSLLVIITADFGAGIQLGFGFTLNAVGGLLGLNRVMLFQPLMDGVRSGAIDDIMFPRDIVANAPRIISDLRAIFPPRQGTFLIGPMAKLGWGEPTLVSLSLGVIIQIPPGDIAILGVLRMALPADDIAILVLQVNFAGALEFSKQRLYFFASLFDSHILFITINGEMGLLFAWGDDANFVVSIGGFHPQFNPPPLPFPAPRRISVDIINESFARIHADGYFAVTSNTVQFGTHSEYFFGFDALSVSGHSGFDALIQFSPFHFEVEISTSFSVKVFGIGVYGVDIDLSLTGPTPWHAHGTASLSFFFFSIGIGIDFTWGDDRNTTLPPVPVMPVLVTELGKQSNWKAVLPSGSNLLVTLRTLNPAESQFVLHPVGALQISQRAVPLDLTLDKFGNQQPSDANRFSVSVSSPDLAKTRDLQSAFAPAQFKILDDAAKLSQAAFAPQDSGLELAGAGEIYATGTAICRIVRYDVTIIDTMLRRISIKFSKYVGSLFLFGLSGNSAARSVLSASFESQTHPFDGLVKVSAETFQIASTQDNTAAGSRVFTSQNTAADYLRDTLTANPALAGTLHVLPQFEVVA